MKKEIKAAFAPGDKRIRKLAVYGRRSSGKTCIMTALAMSRLPNPQGYGCIWISDVASCPYISDEDSRPNDDPLLCRSKGKEWLADQIEQLERGSLPRANEQARFPFRLLFQFTKTRTERVEPVNPPSWMDNPANYIVELVDYSGELVNPDNDSQFANILLKHLDDCDGLLVLAEATTSPQQHQKLHKDLNLLSQVLPQIAERRKKAKAGPFPIALLLNKWDRMLDMNELTPLLKKASRPDLSTAQRQQSRDYIQQLLDSSLDRFFDIDPPVPQNSLAKSLEAVAGGEQYFRTFPVSALGACSMEQIGKDNVQERPISCNPLMSFGIENPFIWICQLDDSLKLQKLTEKVDLIKPSHFFAAITGKTRRIAKECKSYEAFYPKDHPFAKRIAELHQKVQVTFGAQLSVLGGIAACFLLMGTLIWVSATDAARWRVIDPLLTAKTSFDNEPGLEQKLTEAEKFTREYSAVRWYRTFSYIFVRSSTSAAKALAVINRQLGTISEEERLLASILALDDRLSKSDTLAEVDEAVMGLRELVIPDQFTKAKDELANAINKAKSKQSDLIKSGIFATLQSEIENLLGEKQIVSAANKVMEAPEGPVREHFQSRVSDQAIKLVSEKVLADLKVPEPSFDRIVSEIQATRQSPNVRKIVGEARADSLQKLMDFVSVCEDRHCYQKALSRNSSIDELQNYLKQTKGRGFFVRDVEQRLDYLRWQEKAQAWTVSVEQVNLNYQLNYLSRPTITVRLSIDGSGSQTYSKDRCSTGDVLSPALKSTTGLLRPLDNVKIEVVLENDSQPLGSATWSGKIEDFLRQPSHTLTPSGNEPKFSKNVIRIRSDGSVAPDPAPLPSMSAAPSQPELL